MTYFCKRCGKTIIGESATGTYAPEVGRSNPRLTEWYDMSAGGIV